MSKVKIVLYQEKIRELSKASIRALEKTAEALHEEIQQAQVVPRMDGTLQGESFFRDESNSRNGIVELIHDEPYARRLYKHPEYKFHKEPWEEPVKRKDGRVSTLQHDGNPNAKGKWFEDWLPGGVHEDFAQEIFNKKFKEEAGL